VIIGVPTEIKTREYRVGINPGGVLALTAAGHEVRVQRGAGIASGISDVELETAGATIVPSAADAWNADMVMKVKEPIREEYGYFREGQVLYTYLHLAPLPELTKELMAKKVRAIAYETIQLPNGSLPLLTPMSEVAGRLSVQVGARCLEKQEGGKGLLLGGVPGTRRGRVAILGGGIVGSNAAQIAIGLGAHVTVLDIDHDRMAHLEDVFQGEIETLYSNPATVAEMCA
jgi:alanine dehydrogenase